MKAAIMNNEVKKNNAWLNSLLESNGFYQGLFRKLPVAMYICDKDGYITFYNDAAVQLWGREPVPGKDTWCGSGEIYRLDGTPMPLEECPMAIVLKEGRIISGAEMIIGRPDGSRRYVQSAPQPVSDNTGKIVGAVNLLTDITDQKAAEKLVTEAREQLEKKVEQRTSELVHMNEELERSNYELEQYAYIASHDLQEPLRKIQTFAEMLKTNLHDAAAVEIYYDKISASAKRMSSLIKDVLNYSRLAKSGYTFGTVDLNQVLQDVKSDFELLIDQKKAVIEVVGGKLPAVKGDAQQLRQLFANLMSNSLKFCERQPYIQLHATLIDLPAHANDAGHISGHYVELVFTDNGIGFEQKYADQIFVVFKRLNNRQFYSGTGIGLSVCKRIVQRHGGMISVNSEPGKGTTFTILLPAVTM